MDFSKLFREYIENDQHYITTLDIVRKNSRGKIWLIGGALSRNLSALFHEEKLEVGFDFDFIVEEMTPQLDVPEGWSIEKNLFENPKLVSNNLSIDIVPIDTVYQIKKRNLDPTIENVLLQTPFTIQSIAYDVDQKEILGDLGIEALKKKEFSINHLEQAKVYASKKGIDLNELIKKKAESMGFTPVFVDE